MATYIGAVGTDAVRLKRDDDRWLVYVDDDLLGEVYKARMHTDRYRHESPSLRGRGRTRWMASNVNDDDFDTRWEAVTALLRNARRTPTKCEAHAPYGCFASTLSATTPALGPDAWFRLMTS